MVSSRLPADVGGKTLALGRAHPIVRSKRVIEHGAEVDGDALQVLLRLGDGQDVGKAGDGRRGDLALKTAGLVDLAQRLVVALRKRAVELDDRLVRRRGVDGDEHVYLAARDGLLHPRLHGVLGEDVGARHLDGAVKIAVVDRADLDGDIAAAARFAGSSVARHAFDQCDLLLIQIRTYTAGRSSLRRREDCSTVSRGTSSSRRRCRSSWKRSDSPADGSRGC